LETFIPQRAVRHAHVWRVMVANRKKWKRENKKCSTFILY
jgi:hypothetical protein